MATKSNRIPCEECGGTGWLIVGRQGVTGAKRCACMPPVTVRAVPPQRAEPVLTADEISGAVEGLASIPWFPKEEGARTMIADAIARLCSDSRSCFELVRRMVDGYKEWPGVREMRICYCALIGVPLSGDDLHLAISEYYPDGFGRPVAAQSPLQALPPGHVVSEDRFLDQAVREIVAPPTPAQRTVDVEAAKEQRREFLRQEHRKVMAALNLKPVTQEQIDQAVQEAREKRARAELEGAA